MNRNSDDATGLADPGSRPLAGIRVLEVASWVFVPATAAILADWGAEIIKIEAPATGDPARGLVASSVVTGDADLNWPFEQHNRSKRSVGVDLRNPEGVRLLYRMAASADVFLTSFLPAVRKRLGIDVEDIRRHAPHIIYAKGSALGPRGPESDRGGYDYSTFWSRSGIASIYHHPALEYPLRQSGAFGDTASAQSLAGGVAAALLRRERTGVPSVVDTSLLSVGAWMIGMDMVAAASGARPASTDIVFGDRTGVPNPLSNVYRTRDGRFLVLVMLESDRFWPDLCHCLGRPDLVDDPRFADASRREANRGECVAVLDEIFAAADLDEWLCRLAPARGVWATVQSVPEAARDPQMIANDYLVTACADGRVRRLVASPVQFDERAPHCTPAPEHGAHTEAVLLEAGLDWDEIIRLKEIGAVL